MVIPDASILLDIDRCTKTTPLRNIIYLCAHTDFILQKQILIKPEFKDITKYIVSCNNYEINVR